MTYRLYFNQCSDWPQIWSVDEGSCATEVNVIGVRAELGVTWTTARAEHVPDTKREPVAWLEVQAGSVAIEGGVAVFRTERAVSDVARALAIARERADNPFCAADANAGAFAEIATLISGEKYVYA